MELSDSSIDKATAHLILHCLRGSQTFTLYEDPLAEIGKVCQELKQKLSVYFSLPEPLCGDDHVNEEILRRMVENDWEKASKPKLSLHKKRILVNKITKNISTAKDLRLVREDLLEAPDEFLLRLSKYPPAKRREVLEEWIGVDIARLGEHVYFHREEESPLKEEESISVQILGQHSEKEEEILKKISIALEELYKKHRSAPPIWIQEGNKGVPPPGWILNNFLTHIKKPLIERIKDEQGVKKLNYSDVELFLEWYQLEEGKLENRPKKRISRSG